MSVRWLLALTVAIGGCRCGSDGAPSGSSSEPAVASPTEGSAAVEPGTYHVPRSFPPRPGMPRLNTDPIPMGSVLPPKIAVPDR